MSNPSRETPGSMITAGDREFKAPRSLSRLGQIIPSRLRVPLVRLGLAGLFFGGAANIVPDKDPRGNMLSPRTAHAQDVPTKPDPSIVYGPDGQPVGRVLGITDENGSSINPAPGEGGEELSPVEKWIQSQPIVDTVTFKDPVTNEERVVVNMRATVDSRYQIKINSELKEGLANWVAEQMKKPKSNEPVEYVFVGSIPDSVFPNIGQWGKILKRGTPLSYYMPANPGKSPNLLGALPEEYDQYSKELKDTVAANMGGVFMNNVFTRGEEETHSDDEESALQASKASVGYNKLFDISPKPTLK